MKTGDILENRYRITAPLGNGGMSRVFLGEDLSDGQCCAIKVIRCVNKHERNAALRESEILRTLNHPAIPKLLDVLQKEEEAVVLIMEYIPGISLAELLDQCGPQPQTLVRDWAMQICEVLEYLHTQTPPLIFCDLKPGNLIWAESSQRLVLIDFGSVCSMECGDFHKDKDRKSFTHIYASPEQFENDRTADQRSDIYCLGTTIYRLLTGAFSFSDGDEIAQMEEFFPHLSKNWSRILSRCTRWNPDERYQSVAQVRSAITEIGDLCDFGRTEDAHVAGMPQSCVLREQDEDTQTGEPDTERSEAGSVPCFEILESIFLIHTDLSIE